MEIGTLIDPLLMLQSAKPLPRPTKSDDPAAARQAAEEFESFFVAKMLEHMFAGVSTEAPFGGGNGERIWRSFLIDKYGDLIAKTGGLGIADAVERQLLRAQEGV